MSNNTPSSESPAEGADIARQEPAPIVSKPEAKTNWWHRLPKAGQVAIISAVLVVVASIAVAATGLRYVLVGLIHKGELSVTVVDDVTHQPLLGAQVESGKREVLTDKQGHASLTGLPLGAQTITVVKHDYKTMSTQTTLFLSSVNLGTIQLHSTGVLIKFMVKDWVSDQVVAGAEVTIGNSTGASDATGAASVSIAPNAIVGAQAVVKKTGYNDLTLSINKVPSQLNVVSLVPAGKVYFLSNRNKTIDLYQADLDGSKATVILAGTGSEDTQTGILLSQTNPNLMALVSSRAGHRDQYGNLQHDLFVLNASGKDLTKVADDVQFTDYRAWSGDKLVYLGKSSVGHASIKVYSSQTKQSTQIAEATGANAYTSASINILLVNDSKVYYAVAADDVNQKGVFAVGISGQNAQRLDSSYSNYGIRQTKNALLLETYDNAAAKTIWKTLDLASNQVTPLANGPAIETNRGYADSVDGKYSLFIETRDSLSELYLTDGNGANEKTITHQGDVNQFVQWYGNQYVVVSTNKNEDALYVVPVSGGAAKKITDFYKGNGFTYGGGGSPTYQ